MLGQSSLSQKSFTNHACKLLIPKERGNSSAGRAQPCQGWGRGFESRFPLQINNLQVFFQRVSLSANSFF